MGFGAIGIRALIIPNSKALTRVIKVQLTSFSPIFLPVLYLGQMGSVLAAPQDSP